MKQITATAFALMMGAFGAGPAVAQTAVVVELFTSQGCSSCPPADALLGELTQTPGVIALALHVDYWDYLGWKDQFADPKFTHRQKAYAHAARDKMIYTPQMVVQGQLRIVGSRQDEIMAAVAEQRVKQSPVRLSLTRKEGRVQIRAEAISPSDRMLRVQLVRFKPVQEVTILHGENAGRTIRYHNVVSTWQQIGQWNDQAPLSLDAEVAGAEPLVVIIQAEGPAEILAAAELQ